MLPPEEVLAQGDPADLLPPGKEQLHRPLPFHQDPGGLQEEVRRDWAFLRASLGSSRGNFGAYFRTKIWQLDTIYWRRHRLRLTNVTFEPETVATTGLPKATKLGYFGESIFWPKLGKFISTNLVKRFKPLA